MAPSASSHSGSSRGTLTWRPTKIMNMRDLSKDDDFLSHLLVEKMGTGSVPLLVHKMDGSRRLPKVSAHDLLEIVRRLVVSKSPLQHSVRNAVDELFLLAPIRYYLQTYTQKQINAFATHASRYFELYHPSGSIEISHTSRYSHRTGKSELCILATRNLAPGIVITELKGSMANLTDEEDRELKRTDLRHSDIRRDFSVIHSKSMKKNHLFLGPARFVNHDCEHNCELFREGRYITFRVIKPILIGEEVTAHYGDSYFGRKNRHCLCETCEKKGRGGYAPDHTDDDAPSSDSSSSDSDSDSDSDVSSSGPETDDIVQKQVNLDERRTRRGVYAVVSKEEDQSDESDDEDGNIVPLAGATDIPSAGEIELVAGADTASDLTSLPSSRAPSNCNQAGPSRLPVVTSVTTPPSRSSSSLSSLSSGEGAPGARSPTKTTPYQSIISTRRQKAHAAARLSETSSTPVTEAPASSVSPSRRLTRASASLTPNEGKQRQHSRALSSPIPKRIDKGKGREDSVKVKKEDSDPRTLRARQSASATSSEAAKEGLPKPAIPKGPDGKPLPICATCRNILPVISVDHQIVWGLGLEKESKKKKAKQDCPRCMRHFAIYGQPWPRRSPLPGFTSTFIPTPREETTPLDSTRKVTDKVLPVLDRKIAAVASSKRKRSSEEVEADEGEEERPAKKHKSSNDHSPQQKRLPIPLPEGQKRKRGRPRLSSVPRTVPPTVKKEDDDTPLHPQGFKSQGRRMNGRFERKTSLSDPRKGYDPSSPENALAGRAQRALEREKIKESLEKEMFNKRRLSEGDVDRASKRERIDGDGDEALPLKRVFPRRSTSIRSGNLFSRPNPMSFAARAWANPLVSDDGSSDDDKGPDTPEDGQSPPAIVEVELDEVERGPSLIVTAPAIPPAYKPSPFSFARRRWSSLSTTPVDEQTKRPNESRPPHGMERILGGQDGSYAFSERHTSSYDKWTPGHDMYSSEEEDPRCASVKADCLPVDDELDKHPLLLQLKYPSDVAYTRKSPFVTDSSILRPNFIDPGWESDISDS